MRAFQQYAGLTANYSKTIWQEYDEVFPFTCSKCHIYFEKGGLRYLGSSITRRSHNADPVLCPDCKAGRDPHRKAVPKLAERRTELD